MGPLLYVKNFLCMVKNRLLCCVDMFEGVLLDVVDLLLVGVLVEPVDLLLVGALVEAVDLLLC